MKRTSDLGYSSTPPVSGEGVEWEWARGGSRGLILGYLLQLPAKAPVYPETGPRIEAPPPLLHR